MNTMAHLWMVPASGGLGYLLLYPLLEINWIIRERHRIYRQYRFWR